MRVDVSLTTTGTSLDQLAEAARSAEVAGFDGVWVYDHLSGHPFAPTPVLDVWGALATVVQATERVTVGPLVVNVPVRHPAHVAVALATAQQMSGGRLLVGLGAGAGPGDPYGQELRMLGLPVLHAAERREQVADAVRYLKALWSGARVYEGSRFSAARVTAVAVPSPVPPIIVGANGPRLAAVAGEVADGLNVHDWLPDMAGTIAVARARAGDRPFEVSIEAPLEPAWLDPASAERRHAAALGVARLVLRWRPEGGTDVAAQAAGSRRS